MRTTLDIPADLMDEVKRILRFKSKTDIVIHSLKEIIRRHQIDELKKSFGTIKLDLDISNSRERARRKAR